MLRYTTHIVDVVVLFHQQGVHSCLVFLFADADKHSTRDKRVDKIDDVCIVVTAMMFELLVGRLVH